MSKRDLSEFSNSKAKIDDLKPNKKPKHSSYKSKCLFQSLPNDVLEYVYSFLSSKDLIAISNLNCGKISGVARYIEVADFSSCNDILPAELEHFTNNMTGNIEILNLTSLFLVSASDIVKAIVQCKNLTSLTVIECGVTLQHMHHILMQCKQLKELCWNVLPIPGDGHTTYQQICSELCGLQIEKLYFYIDGIKPSQIGFQLLRRCTAISEACFNFTAIISPHLPLRTWQKNIVYKLHSYPICPVSIILDDYFENMQLVYSCIQATNWCNCSNKVGTLYLPMLTPYLQLVANNEDCPASIPLPEKSVKELVLYYSSKLFLQQKMEDIKRVTGNSLAVLTVKEKRNLREIHITNEEEDRISMSELVPKLILNCCYIQALILSSTHFSEPLMLQALYCLKGLKTLALPSCAFSTAYFSLNPEEAEFKRKSFEGLVQNCRKVEHFSLIKCDDSHCIHEPQEGEILAISNWKKLTSLSIINIQNLKHCDFLQDIGIKCPDFKSFDILDIHSGSLLFYIPNVVMLLSTSPQLMHLCLHIDILCIKNFRFWNAISSPKNLRSLCLTITVPANVDSHFIAQALKKLPHLHIFHLTYVGKNEGLASRVK